MLLLVAGLAACQPGDSSDRSPTAKPSFDYWVLALSWSPEYCASNDARPDSNQCARPREFIVHGLWPQFERGYPASCDTSRRVSEATADRLAPLVPDRGLVFHQWRKHGSCSGMDPDTYFATLERAGRGIKVPSQWLREASQGRTLRREEIEAAFIEANPRLTADAIAVDCRKQHLREIRVCLDLELAPRPCGADVPDACAGNLRVRPAAP